MRRRAPLIPRCVLAGLAVCLPGAAANGALVYSLADAGVPVGIVGIVLVTCVVAVAAAAGAVHDRLHVCSVCGVKHADHDV